MFLSAFQLIGLWLFLAVVESTPASFHEMNRENEDSPQGLSRHKRYLMKRPYLWPKALVPYRFEASGLSNEREIQRVIDFIEDKSCIRFLPAKTLSRQKYGLSHNANISFWKGDGCFSGVGWSEDGVRTSCCTGEACLHEIGHALGFNHEQENPKRDGWIEVNMDVIPDSNKAQYMQTSSDRYDNSRPYDISTMMHYFPVEFTKGKPAYAKSFPELSIAQQYFYFFKEMADGYRCADKPQCQGRTLQCENDGFQTIVHGKCKCECPTGLDPDNLCKTPLKKVTSSWPKGQYSLPKPKSGCPSGGQFKDGHITQTGIGANYMSDPYDMMGEVKGTKAELHFCTRTTQDDVFSSEEGAEFNWPHGNYCVYMEGNKCPTGFDAHSIRYKVNSFVKVGLVPEIEAGHMRLCCQFRGFTKEPASFPTTKPFALIKSGSDCQKVTGMRSTIEHFTIKSSDQFRLDPIFYKWRLNSASLSVPLCYYKAVDMNCGDVRTLSRSNRETTIEMSGWGKVDAECTWVVKGDTERGTFVLDFEEFNVRKEKGVCVDKVEVRHAMIGQFGQEYCGTMSHSIRSITNKILVRFFTTGNSESSFKAKIKWIPFDDMCYDVDKKGISYDGSVSYTRLFQPCLPWAEMTGCPHNPFLKDRYEQLDLLEGNACRNPDNSYRPWCYTDKAGCQRNYCDVCGLEKPYDIFDNCPKLKQQGFCTRDFAKAIQNCAATCYSLIPNKPLTKKYTEISCARPTAPRDGSIIGIIKNHYKLGETVDYKCTSGRSVVTSRCMTSGQWSKIESACRACPPDYSLVGNRCIGLPKGASKLHYTAAVGVCKAEGGTVAAPRSQEEAKLIMKVANNQYVWIGIKDTVTEGTWLYEDGTQIVWSNWDKSEPNNINNEDYCVMKTTTKWMDIPGQYSYYFTCSIPKWEPTTCSDVMGDKCPSLLSDRPSLCTDYPDFAKEYCSKSCGLCRGVKVLCNVQATESNVVTLSTPDRVISVGEFVKYGCGPSTFPVAGDETRACLLTGRLSGEPLQCEDCPLGFKSTGRECHGLLLGKLHTFKEAQAECKAMGGFVAMPKTQAENDVISSLGLGREMWIGATDSVTEGIFMWEDVSSVYWDNWANGEPKSNGNDIDCVFMNDKKQWVNVKCSFLTLTTVCTIPKPDSCYGTKDKGVSYDGDISYTRTHQACLPWAQVTQCSHHSFNKGDELDNLVGNACRNPDSSIRPWCYTHANGCKREYCNVCGKATETTTYCGQPTPPKDAAIVGQTKPIYNVGDTVQYKCHLSKWSTLSRCMASGHWSQTNYVCTECPFGFTLSGDTCYGVMDRKHNYRNAVEACKEKGAVVAVPKNREEAKHIIDISTHAGVWLGVSDEKNEGNWEAEDGTKPVWTNWNAGEPNGKRGENCVWMFGGLVWVDVPCNYNLMAVCTVPKLRCPTGFTLSGDMCYRKMDKLYNYREAVAACRKNGAMVFVPKSKEEQQHVLTSTKSSTIWVGVSDEKTEGTWTAEDGTKPVWTNWNSVEPNGGRGENCVLTTGGWVDVPCGYQLPTVCSTPSPESNKCKDYLHDQCPKLLTDKPTMCQELPDYSRKFCAGTCGVCSQADVSCTVANSNPFVKKTTPGNSITTGHYVEYSCDSNTEPSQGKEVRACLPNGELTGEPLQCEECQGSLLNGNCYRVLDQQLTYDAAMAQCKTMGSVLAAPKSKSETDFITNLMNNKMVWVGATDRKNEGTWEYEDGTKISWINWGASEPNNMGSHGEDCAAMYASGSGMWLDVPCNYSYRSVCVKKKFGA